MNALASLWIHRGVLIPLVRHDLRKTHAGVTAGIVWTVLLPLVPLLVYCAVFSLGLRLTLAGAPYALAFAAGYLPWVLISGSIVGATQSLLTYRHLVKRVAFPVEIIPLHTLVVQTYVHLILLALVVSGALISGHRPSRSMLSLPYFYVCAIVLTAGGAWLAASVAALVRDAAQAVPFAVNLWFWVTPIAWAPGLWPPAVDRVLLANPISYIVAGYRHALLPDHFAAPTVAHAVVFWSAAFALLAFGLFSFRRLRPHFWECL